MSSAPAPGPGFAPGPVAIDVRVRRSFDVCASLVVEAGERLAIFGPSGAGKTSLVETVAGLVTPSAGAVRMGGEVLSAPVEPRQRHRALARRIAGARPPQSAVRLVSIVRQPTTLFPHLDVLENVAYGGVPARRAARFVEAVGLADLIGALPATLSGGQAQRAALARGLAREFALLVLDEPMSAVDVPSRARLWDVIAERLDEQRASAILVTHDLGEAQAFGDRIAVLDWGQLLALGEPHSLVAAPPTRRAAEVLGYAAFVRLSPGRGETGGGTNRPGASRQVIEVALDRERIRLGAHEDLGLVLSGRVVRCRPVGARFEAVVSIPTGVASSLVGIGECTVVAGVEISVVVDDPLHVGIEVLATALSPPVFGAGAALEVPMEVLSDGIEKKIGRPHAPHEARPRTVTG